MEIDINREDFYEFKKPKDRTKSRIEEIKKLGMAEVGIAEFGVDGIVSGLFIERVWRFTEDEWKDHIDWMKSVIKRKQKM